jgi:cell division FtsZ-interacting protein ZapD
MNIFQLEKAGKNAVLYEEQVKERMSFMSTLADSLNYLGVNKGISNVENQAKEYTKAYNEAVISGNEKARNAFELKLKELGKYSGTYQLQSEQIKYESENLAKLRTNLYDAKSQLTQGNPYFYKFVVEHAKISDKKDSPKRLLIVLLSTLSAFLFTFMVLVLKKNISNTFKE